MVKLSCSVLKFSLYSVHLRTLFLKRPVPGKLLLNRRELDKLLGAVNQKGYSCVPLVAYWKGPRAKLEIALVKGKQLHDKRATEKDRDWQRDKARIMHK